MTAGSVLGAAALAVVATAPNLPVFTAGWLLAGLAMAATFYQPAFAALTRWYGRDRVRALTTLTLAGGLASTVFAPITAALTEHLGWRRASLTLAARRPVRRRTPARRGPARPLAPARSRPPGEHPGTQRPAASAGAGPSCGSRPPSPCPGSPCTPSSSASSPCSPTAAPPRPKPPGRWARRSRSDPRPALLRALAVRTSPRTRTAVLIAAGGVTTALLAAVPGPCGCSPSSPWPPAPSAGTSPSCRRPPSPTGGALAPTVASPPPSPPRSPSPAPSPPGPVPRSPDQLGGYPARLLGPRRSVHRGGTHLLACTGHHGAHIGRRHSPSEVSGLPTVGCGCW